MAIAMVIFGLRSLAVEPAAADVQSGSYSLEVDAVEAGGVITADAIIEHDGANPGNYQTVTWHVLYDPGVVSVASMSAAGGAPAQCASTNDNGVRVLLGCIDIFGDNLTLSGTAFQVTFACDQTGDPGISLNVAEDTGVTTTGGVQPDHIHQPSVTCPGPPTDTPTPTNTPLPPTPTPTATPCFVGEEPCTPTPTPSDGDRRGTATPIVTETPEPTATSVPEATAVPTEPPPPPPPATATPFGGPGGVVVPPVTGSGDGATSGSLTWLWILVALSAMALAGAGGAYLRWGKQPWR